MKIKKIMILITTLLLLLVVLPVEVHAAEGFTFPTWNNLMSSGKNFLSKGKNNNISTEQMGNMFAPMARILLSFGIIVILGCTIIMGIKYMLATPEEAAKLKQQLIGLVVSAFVIFGAVVIWTLAYQVFSSVL